MKETKVLAFFLPQYHEIEENNIWWGKGFTEWTNVKSAKPLYKGHYQPKVPCAENYYDLSRVETLVKQVELATRYGVDGFCFYHYWFEGKKLLEKPMELLLTHPEIHTSYCLSWANETWSRRWNGEEKKILIKQTYGEENDWEAHFRYLLPFFQDTRYIRIDEKPVVILYRAFDIPRCDEMISYWNDRMREEGLGGIYVIETLNSTQKGGYLLNSSAYAEFEPMYTIYKYLNFGKRAYRYLFHHLNLSNLGCHDFLSYDKVWKLILQRRRYEKKKIFLGAFPGWDNTARKGKDGLVIKGSTPQKFQKYFQIQFQESVEQNKEFLFINAWNEWGEGAYLEPDECHEFAYLQAIRDAKREVLNENS